MDTSETRLLGYWRASGGYYNCPKDHTGNRLGPLVGYAGTYEEGKHYVGDVYFNFATVEERSMLLEAFAIEIYRRTKVLGLRPSVVLGAPMGGILLAAALGRILQCRTIFAEKKITALATLKSREESVLTLNRHQLFPEDRVLIVEDVCNNFSTTGQILALIRAGLGVALGIACALNSSGQEQFQSLNTVAALNLPSAQYRQDDPAVLGDIQRGNVVWKPKNNWTGLEKAMSKAAQG